MEKGSEGQRLKNNRNQNKGYSYWAKNYIYTSELKAIHTGQRTICTPQIDPCAVCGK